jgi:hypothetical protein
MPTEYRFDDLDLREEPANLKGGADEPYTYFCTNGETGCPTVNSYTGPINCY